MESVDTKPTPDNFPRQYARTRRFSLGEPRSFQISPDGRRIVFLRSGSGSDSVTRLWILERSGQGGWVERCVFDPTADAGAKGPTGLSEEVEELSVEERARRERMRETSGGITAYDVDHDSTKTVFALGGALHTINLIGTPKLCTLNTPKGPYDPRLSPDGRLVGFVADRGLHIIAADGSDLPSVTPLSLPVPEPAAPGKADASHTGGPQHVASRTIAIEDSDEVVWGVADFNAAEEFDRYRGFWWSPDSQSILAARVDNSPVETWWIADPAHPSAKPIAHRYPAAGTPNAIVTLHVLHLEQTVQSGGARLQTVRMSDDATLDHQQWPYLVHVAWTEVGCTAVWMNRAQDHQITVDIDPSTGATRVLTTATDEAWVELLPGTPVRLGEGFLLHAEVGYIDGSNPTSQAGNAETADQGGWPDPQGTHYLVVVDPNGAQRAITPANLQVRRVARVTDTHVVFTANASRPLLGAHSELVRPDPASSSVFRVGLDGSGLTLLAGGADVGVHDVVGSSSNGAVQVIRSASTNRTRAEHRVAVEGETQHLVATLAEIALVNPKPIFFRAGPAALNCAAFLPSPGSPGALHANALGVDKFPILMDPYAGPHAQRVVQARNAHATSQWFADQGFVVIVVDGRGTPGLGPLFERAVKNDLAIGVLDDQITGLHEAATLIPQADLTRVGIRGWSFGGFLAGLAVMERPDVFHCGIVGAPVTEWRLYDTGYTERYLGNPVDHPEIYDANSLLTRARKLTRPMMLVHGLADDNVVAANTLQLSSALLAAGKPHEVLPLSGVTHMTPQEDVAENLLKLQVEFLNRHLR